MPIPLPVTPRPSTPVAPVAPVVPDGPTPIVPPAEIDQAIDQAIDRAIVPDDPIEVADLDREIIGADIDPVDLDPVDLDRADLDRVDIDRDGVDNAIIDPDLDVIDRDGIDVVDTDLDIVDQDLEEADVEVADLDVPPIDPDLVNPDDIDVANVDPDLIDNTLIDNDIIDRDTVDTDVVDEDLAVDDLGTLPGDPEGTDLASLDPDLVDPAIENADIDLDQVDRTGEEDVAPPALPDAVDTDAVDTDAVDTDVVDVDPTETAALDPDVVDEANAVDPEAPLPGRPDREVAEDATVPTEDQQALDVPRPNDRPEPPREQAEDNTPRDPEPEPELTVELAWQSEDDLNLHIVCPDGTRIHHLSPNGCGGRLLGNANSGGNVSPSAQETIAFNQSPDGPLRIEVDNFNARSAGDPPAPFQVRIRRPDGTVEIVEGAVSSGDGRVVVHELGPQ